MKRTTMLLMGLAIATQASGQTPMRVQGPRPVDPRLRSQPMIGTPLRPAVDAPAPVSAREAAKPGRTLQTPSYLRQDDAASSSGPSALDLMKQCFDGSVSGSIVNPSCVGYLAGFIGATRISAGASEGYPICLPETGLANEAIVSEVSAYLEENPGSLQKSARSVVFLVLSSSYPCATEGKK